MRNNSGAGGKEQVFSRLIQCLLIVCALGLLSAYWSLLASTPALDWNAARIFPAFLLAGGISPYAVAGSGPATGWIYGPVMPFLYLPATLAPTITSAMLVSAVINLLILVGPMLIVSNAAANRAGLVRWEKIAVWLAFFGLLPVFPTLRSYLYCVIVDQVAIGLALLSIWFLASTIHEPAKGLGGAAFLAVLAVWTKQIAVIIPLAQLLYLGVFQRDRAQLWHYLIWLLGIAAAITGCMILIFGLEPLVFNLWIVPAGHSLKGWAAFVNYAGIFAAQAVPCVVLTVGLAAFTRKKPARPGASFQKTLLGLLLTIAVVEIPLNLLGACKVGGAPNSFHALPLFFTAMIIALIASAGWWRARISQARVILTASLLTLIGTAFLLNDTPLRLSPMPHLEAARIIASQYPGQVYFPDNPLIVWWTERKLHHLEYGLIDQAMAGYPATQARYFKYLPDNPRLVVYATGRTGLALQVIPSLKRVNSSQI